MRTHAHAFVRRSKGMSVSAPVVIHVCASLCTRMRDHAHVRLCTHGKPLGSSDHPIIRGFCLSVNVLAMPFSFNLVPTPLSQASGKKRAGEAGASQQAKKPKLPPLTDLVAMESAPKKEKHNGFIDKRTTGRLPPHDLLSVSYNFGRL